MLRAERRGHAWCPALLMTSAAPSARLVLDRADDRGENGSGNATAGHLADDAADVRGRSAVGEQRNQHAENLTAGAAANGTHDGIHKRPEIDVLGRASCDIAADGAADDLDDQIDEQSDMTRYSPIRCSFSLCRAPDQ